mgnify:CR=1 FL=1
MCIRDRAYDYRYFPEPDLVPLVPWEEWIEEIRATLPVLPAERRNRLASAAGATLPHEGVSVIVAREQDDQALAAIAASETLPGLTTLLLAGNNLGRRTASWKWHAGRTGVG